MPTSDRLQVAFAGRLDRVRGEGLLLEFLEHLPGFVEFHGAIAADERRFADLARRFRSDRIHLYRNLPQSKMPGFLSKVQVLFNPLVVGYGVSRVTLEGMATGRCVLMTGQGDRYPLVTDETGLTCPPNLEAILSALRQLHRTPETIETIGRRARRVRPDRRHRPRIARPGYVRGAGQRRHPLRRDAADSWLVTQVSTLLGNFVNPVPAPAGAHCG